MRTFRVRTSGTASIAPSTGRNAISTSTAAVECNPVIGLTTKRPASHSSASAARRPPAIGGVPVHVADAVSKKPAIAAATKPKIIS